MKIKEHEGLYNIAFMFHYCQCVKLLILEWFHIKCFCKRLQIMINMIAAEVWPSYEM